MPGTFPKLPGLAGTSHPILQMRRLGSRGRMQRPKLCLHSGAAPGLSSWFPRLPEGGNLGSMGVQERAISIG